MFEDVSEQAGLTGGTESWGVSWGDLNGDGCPDAIVQGHRDYPRIYRNNCEGGFEDIAYEIDPGTWISYPYDDKHAVTFADFDNDGDKDFYIGVSATGPGQLFVNDNNSGAFDELANAAGISNDGTSRMALWVDFTQDGYLDIIQFGLGSRTYIRKQDPASGLDFDTISGAEIGFSCNNADNTYGQLLDANNDGKLDLLCAQRGTFPNKLLDISSTPFQDLTPLLPVLSDVNETVVADFNNDLLTDFVLVRGATRPPNAVLVNSQRIEAWLTRQSASAAEKGFAFSAPGAITVTVYGRDVGPYAAGPLVMNIPFGGSDCVGSTRHGICAGFDAADSRWEVIFSDPDSTRQAYVIVETDQPITGLTNIGVDTRDLPVAPRLLLQQSGGGFAFDYGSGINEDMACGGAATGDFNNDMWIDLYLVCRDGPTNLVNRLYLNRGDGSFELVENSGAEGPVGTDFDEIGVGDNAAVADYDRDGFLDIMVVNGLLYYPVGVGGPDVLLRNLGNSNHWLEFNLEGTTSNRDGIGGRVFVTAGGITQLREVNGGTHRFSQDDQTLHFGLAGNDTADVTIEWPSGQVDTHQNVPADKLYKIVENGPISVVTPGPPVYTTLVAGDECGEPPYNLDYGPAFFLWRNCPGNTWFLRAKGGREDQKILFTGGEIVGDAPFNGVTGFALAAGDILDNSVATEIIFNVGVWFNQNKGFDFDITGQSESCFSLAAQDIPAFIVGASGKRVDAPFDLVTLGDCVDQPPPPVSDPECGDPVYDRASDPGLFAWRDCDFPGPGTRWNFHVVGGGLPWAETSGLITGEVPLAATPAGLAGPDFVDSQEGDEIVDFSLFVGGTGVDSFQIDIPDDSSACFEPTRLPSGTEVMVGSERQVITGAFDLATLETCEVVDPPQPDECGEPSFVSSTDPGVFVWRDCEAPGPGEVWQVRITGGGIFWFRYQGTVTSDLPLGAAGVMIEANDVFTVSPDNTAVDFDLGVGGSGIDGFQLDVADGAQTCLDLTALPAGVQIQLGADRVGKGSQLNLATLGACN